MLMSLGKQEFSRQNRNDSGTAGARTDLRPHHDGEPLIYGQT